MVAKNYGVNILFLNNNYYETLCYLNKFVFYVFTTFFELSNNKKIIIMKLQVSYFFVTNS